MAISFPVRPNPRDGKRDTGAPLYKPVTVKDSWERRGYRKTPTNPNGFHWASDIPAPTNSIIQLPEEAKLRAKGHDEDAGYWMEWEIITGPWLHRFFRVFHMLKPCAFSIGTIKNRKYAVGRVDCTGNCSGPHEHAELGKYPWAHARDPRWDIREELNSALTRKDW